MAKIGVLPPSVVARRVASTIRSRPPLAGAPTGIAVLCALANLAPERLWLAARRIVNADRTMGPIDRDARAVYDARIAANTHKAVT